MEEILEKFLLELNDKNIRYDTFINFLNEYDGAYLYIKSNYEMILSNINRYDYISVINYIKTTQLKEVMENKIIETLNLCPNKVFLSFILDIYLKDKSNDEKITFFNTNADILLKTFPISQLLSLAEYKNLDKTFSSKLEEKIKNNKQEYFKNFLETKKMCDNSKELDTLTTIIIMLIDELIKEEYIVNNKQLEYSDISLSKGQHSIVFIIGDKVLNIGTRIQNSIPSHRRILKSTIHKDLKALVPNNIKMPNCIEVSEKVDTESNISEEDLYKIYKDLREDDLIWTDVKKENVGRLLKPNNIYFSKPLATNDNEIETHPLDKGEIVIIDEDYIYDLNTFNKDDIPFFNELAIAFEERYISEKNITSSKKI